MVNPGDRLGCHQGTDRWPDGGKPWKHLNGSCRLLLEFEREGYPKKRVKNIDHKKPEALHFRRQCPVCFCDGCLPSYEKKQKAAFAASGLQALQSMKAEGRDPTHGGQAAKQR
jgi:hypothetical protein